jgi:hypothetical protein
MLAARNRYGQTVLSSLLLERGNRAKWGSRSAKRIHSGSGFGASDGRRRQGARKVWAKEAWTDR